MNSLFICFRAPNLEEGISICENNNLDIERNEDMRISSGPKVVGEQWVMGMCVPNFNKHGYAISSGRI